MFESVSGLTNTTFDPENIEDGRMTTEGSVLQAYNDIAELRRRADACCRDLLIWEAHVQVVRMNTNTKKNYGMNTHVGGTVVSMFEENVRAGVMRRGLPYTAVFPLKWDPDLYVKNMTLHSTSSCGGYDAGGGKRSEAGILEFRRVADSVLNDTFCLNGGIRNGFWRGASTTNNGIGLRLNYNNEWSTGFSLAIEDDGTVLLTDARRSGDFNVMRYYTQWVLKECADGSIIADNPDW